MSDGNGKDRSLEAPAAEAPPTFICVVREGDGPCGKTAAGIVENGAGVDVAGMPNATMHACAEHLAAAHEAGAWHAWFRRAAPEAAAAYAEAEHDHVELSPFNDGMARRAAVSLLQQVRRLEASRSSRSGLLIPDGIKAPPVDINQELMKFMHNADLAIMSVLDLLLEARTGKPVLQPDPNAPADRPTA